MIREAKCKDGRLPEHARGVAACRGAGKGRRDVVAGGGRGVSMAQQMSTPGDAQHAKTDLYDTVRKTFYIQYPVWFVILLALAGVVAFSITGFFGYPSPYADGSPNSLPPADPRFSSPS